MKKLASAIIALMFLSGCAAKTTSSSTASSLPETSSQSTVTPASSAVSSSVSAPLQNADIDKADFINFLEQTGYGIFFASEIKQPQDIQNLDTFSAVGPLSWIWANHIFPDWQQDESKWPEGVEFQNVEDLKQVSMAAYGFEYDFTQAVQNSKNNPSCPENHVRISYNFGPTFFGEPDESTIKIEGQEVSVLFNYTSQSSSKWQLLYYFKYQPENDLCKYQFLRTEELNRIAPVEPDLKTEGSIQYVTTDSLNLRYGPGTEYEVIETLPKGEIISEAGRMNSGPNDWIYVIYGMSNGWVNTEYLQQK